MANVENISERIRQNILAKRNSNLQQEESKRSIVDVIRDPANVENMPNIPRRDIVQDIAGLIEGRTLGIPRRLIEATTPFEIPRGTEGARILGSFGGFSQLARMIGKIPQLAGKGLKAASKRGAVTGAVAAQAPLLEPEEGLSPIQRGARTAIAAVGGAAAGPFFEVGIPAAFKHVRKVIKLPRKFEKRLSAVRERITQEANDAKIKITERLDRVNEILDKQFKKATIQGSKTARSDMRKSINIGKKEYGKRIKAISKEIDESDNPFTKDELRQAIKETREEATELFIDEGGAPLRVLDKIEQKFFPVNKVPEIEVGPNIIKLQDVLGAKKAVDRAVTASVKAGTKGFTSDDIVAAIFNKNIGNRIAQRSENFRPTQASYGELVERTKDAHRVLKIGKPSTQASQAESIIEKVAKDKARGSEIETIRRFERGTKLLPPTRPITAKAEQVIREKIKRSKEAQSLISDIEKSLKQSKKTLTERQKLQERLAAIKSGKATVGKRAVGTATGLAGTFLLLRELKRAISDAGETAARGQGR